MEPSTYDQLQGKRNARQWKRNFRIATLAKGVQDVFTGVYKATPYPDLIDYGLQNLITPSDEDGDGEQDKDKDKDKRKSSRVTLGPEDISKLVSAMLDKEKNAQKGLDFNGRMALYKFTLDEYDRGRKLEAIAIALLIVWIHPSLRSQIENHTKPKEVFDHLSVRYSISDARARELANANFNNIFVINFRNAQDYVNALENAIADIVEAGGFCNEVIFISKLISRLKDYLVFNEFATLYYILRSIDDKFEDKDNVITELLTFESNNREKINGNVGRIRNYNNARPGRGQPRDPR